MKRITLVAILLAAVLLFPHDAARAAEARIAKAGIQLWHPDDWTAGLENDELVLRDPAGQVIMVFDVVEASQVDAALANLETSLRDRGVGNVTLVESEDRNIHGMQAELKSGEAVMEGKPVKLGVGIIETPANNVLLVFSMADSRWAENHKPTILRILDNLRPL